MSTVMESTESEALFMSTREALTFAFNYADQQFARSAMASLYRKPGSGRGLVGVEGAGEAGMIMAEVMRLDPLERDALCVRFTQVRNECACCGHERDTLQVREALGRLEHYAAQNTASTSNLRLVRALVRSYFGLAPLGTARFVAEQYEVHRNTVSNHSGNIKRALRTVERRAEKEIERRLRDAGKVS